MNIIPAYKGYKRMAFFAATRGVFDFDASYEAYCAMTACDADKLVVMTTALRKRLGVKPSQVKFHKRQDSPKSWQSAVDAFYKAYQKWLDEGNGIPTPTFLVRIEGEGDGKDPNSMIAHYSTRRPKKIATPFGGEADNREVF